MHRFLLYPFRLWRLAVKCFTSSGFSRLACLLRKLGAFDVKCIVYSLALLSFISISTFRNRDGFTVPSKVVGLR